MVTNARRPSTAIAALSLHRYAETGGGGGIKASLKYPPNIDCFRGFIEKSNLFSKRSEALVVILFL